MHANGLIVSGLRMGLSGSGSDLKMNIRIRPSRSYKKRLLGQTVYARTSNLPSICTICPRSSDPFCKVSDYIKWVTTSWTHSLFIKIRSVVLSVAPCNLCWFYGYFTAGSKLLYIPGLGRQRKEIIKSILKCAGWAKSKRKFLNRSQVFLMAPEVIYLWVKS